MPLLPQLSSLKRATGTQPGSVSPQAWNALIDYVAELERRVSATTPQPSPDIAHKFTSAGFTSHLKRRPGTRPGKILPFEVYDILVSGESWTCKVWPGHVVNIDPEYGVALPVKYWLPTELDTPPTTPTLFTVDASKQLYIKVETDDKDIITATSVVSLTDDPDPPLTEHAEPPPSAADNGESPPPPKDGVYYYKIADFVEDEDAPSGLRVDKQYHLGSPLVHRPALHEFYNIPETLTGATRYPIAKKWNSTESRYELRSVAQINSDDSGVPILEPLPAGPPTYPDSINFRNIRHRVTGDDASDATQQIEVKESADKKDIIVLGNGKVGALIIKDYEENEMGRIEWDDGLVITEGDVIIILPPPGEVNNS